MQINYINIDKSIIGSPKDDPFPKVYLRRWISMIRIEKRLVAYFSVTGEGFNPKYNRIPKEKIQNYLRENPMPEDPMYTPEYLMFDLTGSEGLYFLPDNVKQETIEYIEDLLNALI